MDVLEQNNVAFGRAGDLIGALEVRMEVLERLARQAPSRLQAGGSVRRNRDNFLKIIVENYLETATMNISPAPYATMPVEHLLMPEREAVLMTQSCSEHVISGNFDRRRVVNAAVLGGHTLSVWGKHRLELFADYDFQGKLEYDSGLTLARRRVPLQQLQIGVQPWGATYGDDLMQAAPLWFESVFAKSYRWTIHDRTASGRPDYWQAGYGIIGRSWSPEVNFDWDASIQWVQDVHHERSEGKSLHSEGTHDKYRRANFSLHWLSEADANLLYEFIRQFGGLKEFYVSMYPKYHSAIREIEHGFLGRFTGELPERKHAHPNNYTAPIELEEI